MDLKQDHEPNTRQAQTTPPDMGSICESTIVTGEIIPLPSLQIVDELVPAASESSHDNDNDHAENVTSASFGKATTSGVCATSIDPNAGQIQAAYALQNIPATVLRGETTLHDIMAELAHKDYALSPAPFRVPASHISTVPPLALETAPPLSVTMKNAMVADTSYLENPPIKQPEAPRIQAFAKLEFDDGQFYMNTYSVILGRDIRAARLASKKDKDEKEREIDGIRNGQSTSGGDAPQTPVRLKREGSMMVGSSVLSETGGIIGADDTNNARRRRSRKGSKKSKSTTSSSPQHVSRKNSIIQPMQTDYQALAQRSYSDGPHPVDPSSLLPSPDECPLIPIHPPASTIGTGSHKGISRKHVKIAYNFDKHLFEVEIRGKNGAFVDEQWHAPGETRPLKSGSFIQIGGVSIRFLLPEDHSAEASSEVIDLGDKEMSFAFEGDTGDEIQGSSDSEEEIEEEDAERGDNEGDVEEDDEDEDEDEQVLGDGELESEQEEEVDESATPEPVPQPQARRGPGRPPKSGISKRDRELAEKDAKQKIKTREKLKGKAPAISPTKNKVGRPRKNSRPEPEPEEPPVKREKRKYTKRRVAEPGSPSAAKKEKEPKEAKPPKEKKEKRPPKPPRSPSPVFDESKLTAEELAKPQASYVVLIHEALTNSKTGAMSLPQIYRAIERKYPFYKLRVQTTGWQSSVRHNLSQHHAFKKVERDGKGWLWGIVPGVSIEKERKKRVSPPPPSPQQALQQQPISRAMPAPPGLGNGMPGGPGSGIPGPAMPQMLPSKFAMPGLGQGTPHREGHLHQEAPPRGPNGVPAMMTTMQAPVYAHTNPPSAFVQHQAQPLPGKSHSQGLQVMQENRSLQPSSQVPFALMAARPPPSNTAPSPPQPQTRGFKLNEKTLEAIASFQSALVTKLAANGSKDAEAIVQSAVNRALGITDKSSVPGKDDTQEVAIMKAVSGMLNQINNKPGAPSSSDGGADNKPPLLRPQQQHQQVRSMQHSQSSNTGRPQLNQGGRPGGSGQHAVQAQLIQFLSTALHKGQGQKMSPQPGNTRPLASGSPTRVNGTSAITARPPQPAPPPLRTNPAHHHPLPMIKPQLQPPAPIHIPPPQISGIKRPLENGDTDGQGPDAKKLAMGNETPTPTS